MNSHSIHHQPQIGKGEEGRRISERKREIPSVEDIIPPSISSRNES